MNDLKDVILSTIQELENTTPNIEEDNNKAPTNTKDLKSPKNISTTKDEIKNEDLYIEDEKLFLSSLRERLLVLFEGFQAPNNSKLEAKIDLTLNFLEYVLATIDSRLEDIKKRDSIGKI